ncbi:hypothetical protein K437DRAFT_254719 [Tilletiaria anomala UBC 951]|uniref:Mtf2-like C-terminal domain-containing protein n=1 Tax=Tilletiaria anomala (strain ATCC 24038 / CBS 436.72 / UBC 951) TaxID=1037660 RepID=A0A066WMX1_TILAU|nr:uncharacterized protein K437DRAFT_254719 [Tilletiaria anomala UBC 951]KDN51980.1 hypothetical protein K437DRAFT_254719 [Tilletiaria anomala UBC 951]
MLRKVATSVSACPRCAGLSAPNFGIRRRLIGENAGFTSMQWRAYSDSTPASSSEAQPTPQNGADVSQAPGSTINHEDVCAVAGPSQSSAQNPVHDPFSAIESSSPTDSASLPPLSSLSLEDIRTVSRTVSREHLFASDKHLPRYRRPWARPASPPGGQKMVPEEAATFRKLFMQLEAGGEADLVRQFANLPRQKPGKSRYAELAREEHASRVSDEELEKAQDRIKEAIVACETEPQLWRWAEENVWGTLRPEVEAPVASVQIGQETENPNDGNVESESSGERLQATEHDGPQYGMRTPFYATALAELLIRFRDTFQNPHTALAVYQKTKLLGIESQVFGCGTLMYREVIRTQWGCLRDLQGVLATVHEARRKGVLSASSRRTDKLEQDLRTLIERISAAASAEAAPSPVSSLARTFGSALAGFPFGLSDTASESRKLDFVAEDKLKLIDAIEELIGNKKGQPSHLSRQFELHTPRSSRPTAPRRTRSIGRAL